MVIAALTSTMDMRCSPVRSQQKVEMDSYGAFCPQLVCKYWRKEAQSLKLAC